MSTKPTYEDLAQTNKELRDEIRALKGAGSHAASDSVGFDVDTARIFQNDYENLDLTSIINIAEIQSIMNDFYELTHMVTAVLDIHGNVIETTGWQDLCTKFHRVHPETAENCTASDLYLSKNLKPGEYVSYKCKNGLWDVVTPLYVGDKHVGNIYTGQFFYDDDLVDEALFIQQAEMYGFDKEAYIDALRRIPRYSRETIDHLMGFLTKFTAYVSKVGFSHKQLENEIHERERSERALKKSKDQLRLSEGQLKTLIRSMPDLVWLKDKNGVFLGCNKMFENLLGAPEEAIINKTDYDFIDKALADVFRKNDAIAIASNVPSINEEELTFASDGHTALYETIKTPMYDVDGKLIGVLGVARNITKRKQIEAEKEFLQTQLSHAQKMQAIGQLAGGIAHDFNNQLGVLMGCAEVLKGSLDKQPHEQTILENVFTSINHAKRLTEQLLAFSRKGKMRHETLDLHSIIDEVKLMLERSVDKKIRITLIYDVDSAITVGDESQIYNVLLNIALNARDAMPSGGEIIFKSEKIVLTEDETKFNSFELPRGDYICISVVDQGCGMDAETQKHVFEPFFTTKEEGKGTGMGLSAAYGTMLTHKGAIAIYSEIDKGTIVRLYFPEVTGTVRSKKKTVNENVITRGEGNILLVDDTEMICDMGVLLLAQLGYTATSFSKPKEALGFFEDHWQTTTLVIIDMIMPEMNGRDLYAELKKINPEVVVLLATGYTLDGEAQKILDEGVKGFIQKPFTLNELSRAIQHVTT